MLKKAKDSKKDVTLLKKPGAVTRKPAGALLKEPSIAALTKQPSKRLQFPKERWAILKPELKILTDASVTDEELQRRVMVHVPVGDLKHLWVPMMVGQMINEDIPALYSRALGMKLKTVITPPTYDVAWGQVRDFDNKHPCVTRQKPWGYVD